jgi:hypothetical protein
MQITSSAHLPLATKTYLNKKVLFYSRGLFCAAEIYSGEEFVCVRAARHEARAHEFFGRIIVAKG